MRIVIALGDVQIEEAALVGDPVVLAARIESMTPPDEIYLSLAAWLAVRSAEVRTSFLGAFPLKGFDEPAPVYRVESRYRTRIFEDQYIVATDLKAFGPFSDVRLEGVTIDAGDATEVGLDPETIDITPEQETRT